MKIKVLQWNILYKENLRKIAKVISELNPDVMCFQELIQDKKRNFNAALVLSKLLNNKYSYYYKEAATWDFKEGVTGQGNGIFSKYPIEKTSFEYVKRYKHNPENAADEGRVYLEVELNVNGNNICVGTTHMSFSVNLKINKSRIEETDSLVKKLRKYESNFIFTGDLNAVPGSYVLNEINKLEYLINAGPDLNEKTWPSRPFDYHGLFKVNNLKYRIDYVYVTKDLNVLSSTIIDTQISDHKPILTILKV